MTRNRPTASAAETGAVVRPLRRFDGDDAALLDALLADHAGAAAELYDRFADHVQRVLVRILGLDHEIPDLMQEVFLQALRSVGSVKDGARLKAWITSVAVHTARGCIRKRTRRRWLIVRPPEEMPEQSESGEDAEGRELLRLTYAVLDKLPAEERIAFALRHIEGLELLQVADALGVSLATVKRKLERAERRFKSLAERQPALQERIARSDRWRSR